MTVEIVVKDDAGKIVAEYQGDAFQPGEYRTLPDRPLVQTDSVARWKLHHFIYSPTVVREMIEKAYR